MNTYKFKNWDLAFGAFVIVGLAVNPVSIDYHYVLILIPVIIMINRLRVNRSMFLLNLFLFFYVLIALDLPYTSTKVTNGIWAIFAYPKLYGALGLLGLTLWISYSTGSVKNHSQHRSVEKE